jgi:coenzyme F420-dependent glucose-6-phosphate dehydrogenase
LPWSVTSDLSIPQHFEQAAALVTEDTLAESILCSPDAEAHIRKIQDAEKAGAGHVYVHQVEKDQDGFFEFYEREVLPEIMRARPAA